MNFRFFSRTHFSHWSSVGVSRVGKIVKRESKRERDVIYRHYWKRKWQKLLALTDIFYRDPCESIENNNPEMIFLFRHKFPLNFIFIHDIESRDLFLHKVEEEGKVFN